MAISADAFDAAALAAELMVEEGLRLKPYTDTMGKLTIGYGRNLTDDGISEAEAAFFLRNDIAEAYAEAQKQPWWPAVADSAARAGAMVDMLFNMGLPTLTGFHDALTALETRDYDAAADALAASAWEHEVPGRADVLIERIRNG